MPPEKDNNSFDEEFDNAPDSSFDEEFDNAPDSNNMSQVASNPSTLEGILNNKSIGDKIMGATPVKDSIMGGVVGAGMGKLGQNLIEADIPYQLARMSGATGLGPLKTKDLDLINQNLDEYSNIKSQTEKYGLSKPIQEAVIDPIQNVDKEATKLIQDSLKDQANNVLTKKEYTDIIQDVAVQNSDEILPGKIQEAKSDILKQKENEFLDNFKKQFEQNNKKSLEDFIEKTAEDEVKKTEVYGVSGQTKEAIKRRKEIKNSILDQVKENPERFGYVPLDPTQEWNNFRKSKEASSFLSNLDSDALKKASPINDPRFPKLLGRDFYGSAERSLSEVNKLMSIYDTEHLPSMKGDKAYIELVRKLRNEAYNQDGTVSLPTVKEVSKKIRELIENKNKEASAVMKEASGKIKNLEKLEDAGFLKRTEGSEAVDLIKDTGSKIKIGDKEASNIMKAIEAASNKASLTTEASDQIKILQNLIKEDKAKALQLIATRAKQMGVDFANVTGGDIARIMMAPGPGGMVGVFKNVLPASQEFLATAGTKFGKTAAGKLAKLGTKSLPAVGAAVGFNIGRAEASEAGFPEEQANVIGGLEAINPIPLTDVAQGAIRARDAYRQDGSISSAAAEGVKGFLSPVTEVVPELVGAFGDLKKDLAKEGEARSVPLKSKETPSPFGGKFNDSLEPWKKFQEEKKQKSDFIEKDKMNNLSNTIEQFNKLKQPADKPVMKSISPEQLDNAQRISNEKPRYQAYADLLEQYKDLTGTDKEKKMFSLMQQPGFRQMMREDEEDEG